RCELQPELRRLMRRLEQQLVMVRTLLRGLLEREQLVGAKVALVIARSAARQNRRELVGQAGLLLSRHALSILLPCRTCSQTPADSALPSTPRWRCGCGPRRSTTSSARRTCSRRAPPCDARSRRTGSARRFSSGRPAAARR